MSSEHVDAVIVGSGFGGAVAACRLAEAGQKVVVLERGREWATDELPAGLTDMIYSSRLPHLLNGWVDARILDQMVVATGAGVGGGSLIYANVSIDAPDKVFDTGWPSQITAAEMAPYFRAVGDVLDPMVIPISQRTKRMTLLADAAATIKAADRVEMLPLAVKFDYGWDSTRPDPTNVSHTKRRPNKHGVMQGTCVHCGNCVLGCPVGAKNTLDTNYLALARRKNADIRPLSLVSHLEQRRDGTWLVHYDDVRDQRRRHRSISADIAILAAGSIGSTEILLRSRDEFETLPNLPRSLGKGWSPNGDFVTLGYYKGRAVDPTMGPTIGAAVDFLDGVDLPDDNRPGIDGRFFIEDGGLPNLGAHLLNSWRTAPKGSWRARAYAAASDLTDFSNTIPWFGQAIDAADGEFSLRSKYVPLRGRLKLNWNPQRSKPMFEAFADTHVRMTEETGGTPFTLSTWRYLQFLLTPHPLGGCNMSSAPATGVTKHNAEVFGHHNLYVMDGAVIPRAIGRNPSKTIAAVAERSCDLLLKSGG